jgi:archaellum component FlaF (FlaF/FlaG flagellin family)
MPMIAQHRWTVITCGALALAGSVCVAAAAEPLRIAASHQQLATKSNPSGTPSSAGSATEPVTTADAAIAMRDSTERVSVDSAGNQANNGSLAPAITANGRFVAFGSLADSLVPGDTNGQTDAFVHDRRTGATERVSVDSAGNQGNNGSGGSAITANGRYVAFSSDADNLVPGDTNGQTDIFVHDRKTKVAETAGADLAGE